jgi:biopolymer transport protein ExbD
MRFLVRKRRTAPAVIIVALIDVLIVLLIFLMVTTTFKQQPFMKLSLPSSTSALKSGANENPPVVVLIDTNGVFQIDKLRMMPEQLHSQLVLRAEKARAENKELKLAIHADKNAPWGKVVQVMDIAKEANIKILTASTKPDSK